jgi:hypothetical protein
MAQPSSAWLIDAAAAGTGAPDVDIRPGWDAGAAFTVEAHVECLEPRPEAMQVLVARWSFAAGLTGFATHDAGRTDGLETTGFFGGVFDGRHVYFAPQCNSKGRHGLVLRYDSASPFDAASSWRAFDAGNTRGLETRGYYGALSDGRYVYFVPRTDGRTHHSRILRLDTNGDFSDSDCWDAHHAGLPVSYQGGALDGRYLYLAPGYHQQHGPSGLVMRLDTQQSFHGGDAYSYFDAAASLGPECACFDGAVFDGRHVYFAPLERGVVLRYHVAGAFSSADSWESHALSQIAGPDGGACVGTIFDGRYVYLVPYGHSMVIRHDTEGGFSDPSSWEAYDAAGTSGLRCRGYDGGAFDGRYVYFIPFWDGADVRHGFHGQLMRYDTRLGFGAAAAWEAADGCAQAPPNPGGFNGGAFDGRYLYMAPWRRDAATPDISAHGQVLRYDTAAADASFVLKFADCGHSGGLGGAVPGPTFTVNTSGGPLTVRANAVPAPGRHQLVGTYSGSNLRLYLDGSLLGETGGGGTLVAAAGPIAIGSYEGGTARFQGSVGQVRVMAGARSAADIAASWSALQ